MEINNYISRLRDISLFKSFTEEELLSLFNKDNHLITNYDKKTLIYLQNERCHTFDIILAGSVVVQTIDENGNILTITTFGIGDNFAGNLVFSDTNFYPMSIFSKNYTTLLKLKKELVLDLCQKDKNFLMEFIKSISNKSYMLGTKLRTITLKTIREQIIDFLTYQYHKQNTLKIKLTMSKKEWSEKLGIHRPSLSRELSKMKSEGLIDYDKSHILIKNTDMINI